MAAHGVGIARICAMVAFATIVALSADAADRTAGVITPDGSPLFIDPWRATLLDSPALSVSITNRHSAPVAFTLRVWVFDQSNQLRGTMTWCVSTPVDRSMRGVFHIPLEIRGVGPTGIRMREEFRLESGRLFRTGAQEVIIGVGASKVLGLKNGAIKFVDKGVMGWGRVRAAARCAAEL